MSISCILHDLQQAYNAYAPTCPIDNRDVRRYVWIIDEDCDRYAVDRLSDYISDMTP